MKFGNQIKKILASVFVLCSLMSCNSDIEPVYVLPSDKLSLAGATGDVLLTPGHPQALAMTIYWSGDGHLALSDTLIQAPVNAANEVIQLSSDESFQLTIDLSVEKGVRSRQFICEELNSLLERLGYTADERAPLYIRIKSVLAENLTPSYSSTLKVMVQSYRISLVMATILDKNFTETAMQLASPHENGIYQGFMGVNAWMNWWLREANNKVWGNLPVDGKTFFASSADDHWNFWFPSQGGCYFTTLNTIEGWWSALHIDNLAVQGDIAGEMTYNMKSNQWTMPINLPQAASVAITINGNGSLYNKETTDQGPSILQPVALGGDAEHLTFGEEAGNIQLSLPAGETTLILDLSNPLAWTIGVGEVVPDTQPEPDLYLSGLQNWDNFDDYLSLYDANTWSYGGAHWIASEWGYRVYTQPDWAMAYKAADEATPLSGSLVFAESDGNIPAPTTGLYVMDFNMKSLTYQLTKVERVTYSGLNDDWTEYEMQPSPDNPEVFTAEFVKKKNTPWGVKVLINGDWGLFFGGNDGHLVLGHSDVTTGFDGDNALTVNETYVLTVDFGKQTYSYSLK